MNKPIWREYKKTLSFVNDRRKTVRNDRSMSDYLKEERIRHYDVIISALNVAMLQSYHKESGDLIPLIRNGEKV